MEVKWDGARMQFIFDGSHVCLRSRVGRCCTDEFPELDGLGEMLGRRRLILDGEIVCIGADGKPDFGALRARLGHPFRPSVTPGRAAVRLMVFDVLHLDGVAVRMLPYARRRELLAELELDGPAWSVPQHFIDVGDALLSATAEQGLEGVVAKRLDARYAEGRRSPTWVKQKHRRRERFLVTGWTEHSGAMPEFFLARQDCRGQLVPAGSASLGLDADRRALLLATLAANERPRRRRRKSLRWAAPVVEVVADFHGPVDGFVRDAVLREVTLPA